MAPPPPPQIGLIIITSDIRVATKAPVALRFFVSPLEVAALLLPGLVTDVELASLVWAILLDSTSGE